MAMSRYFALCAALACLPGLPVVAQAADWVSYRDAYRAMVAFEKYGGAKSLLQQQLQVLPRGPLTGGGGVQLLVTGKTTQSHFPLDATLRTVFPLTRAAYDDNAVMQLAPALGAFTVRPQVTLALRPDNLYDSEELRQGCEQALAYARQLALFGAQRCTGVRFVFSKGSVEGPVALHGGAELRLAAIPAAPFSGDGDATFPIVTYRFNGSAHIQLGTVSVPLAITPLFE
jgi:hypothetical protein